MNRRKLLFRSLLLASSFGLGGLYWVNRWKYIVIHHSAGNYGEIKFLQKVHRQRQAGDPIDAIPYHFVIGNGNGLGMGEIASDWRNDYSLWGMHVSSKNARRNFQGLGICLIGNFEIHKVPEQQYKTLVSLTKSLMKKYGIPSENVTGHGHTRGESTKCPGQYFPMERFKADIA